MQKKLLTDFDKENELNGKLIAYKLKFNNSNMRL